MTWSDIAMADEQSTSDSPRGSRLITALSRSVYVHAPVLTLWILYFLGVMAVLETQQTLFSYELMGVVSLLTTTLPFLMMVVAVGLSFWLIFARKDATLWDRTRYLLTTTPWLEVIVLRFVPGWLLAFLVMRTFIVFKPHIPTLNPFSWDLFFAELDRVLLLGWDAWELSYAAFPGAAWAQAFDTAYVIWFYALFACVAISAVLPLESRVRLAFFLTFALNWIVGGSILAVMFSSAGPVYVERLFGDTTFVDLTDAIRALDAEAALTAADMIEVLWQAYQGNPAYPDLGISAFPSMHLGVAAMVACFARTFGWTAGIVAWMFALMILAGSVHLGWHYLVDGVAGIVMGWFLWRVSLGFADWWLARGKVPSQSADHTLADR